MEYFKIFIGGPSDVAPEVDQIIEMISDISIISSSIGMKFETFYWAKDSTPGLDIEPQARINAQAQGYDAFIAVLGARIGSPTASHDSGTIEEIERAIDAASSSVFGKNSVAIMFKEIHTTSNSSNLKSILRIQEFKETLGPRGILFRDFKDSSDLKNLIYRTFGNIIFNHKNRPDSENSNIITNLIEDENSKTLELSQDQEELGVMDYESIITDKFESSRILTEIVTGAINALSDVTNQKRSEMETASLVGDRERVRETILDVATAMIECAETIDTHSPQIRKDFTEALSATKSLLDLKDSDFNTPEYRLEKTEALQILKTISDSATTNVVIFTEFQESVLSIPRMTKEINSSKRKLVDSTSRLIDMFDDIANQTNIICSLYS